MVNTSRRLKAYHDRGNANTRFGGLDVVVLIILGIFALSVIFPFYYIFVVSITPTSVYDSTNFWGTLWPREVTWAAYQTVLGSSEIWNGFSITVFLLLVGTVYQLFFTVITGYALSRNNWFGKNFVMNMILVTMFFGGGLIPYYLLLKDMGFCNTIWVMFIPGAIDTFNMLLMRNYFMSLPKELEESAKIDGANDIQIFVKIFLPLSLPMLATIGLFFAVGQWNSWYNGMLFNSKPELRTLQQVLQDLIVKQSSNMPSVKPQESSGDAVNMAAIIFTIFPMMCFYPFLQRFFVKGIVVGAIKG